MAKVTDYVSKSSYKKVKKALGKCFPDEKTKVANCHADAFIISCWKDLSDDDCEKMGIPKPASKKIDAVAKRFEAGGGEEDGPILGYYDGLATHERKAAPFSKFTQTLPCARVALPKKRKNQRIFFTEVGKVQPADHLFFSVDELAFSYGHHVEKPIGYVELITPGRIGAARFGAIAVFLMYQTSKCKRPHAYMLEAGLATGEARVPFLGECIDDPIKRRRSWYVPTPFAGARDYYDGHVEVKGHELTRLYIESTKEDETDPYIVVDVKYEKTKKPTWIHPASLMIQAAGRLARIAEALDVEVDQGIMRPVGYLMSWEKKPEGT